MQIRNAASVLPEPVGAEISVVRRGDVRRAKLYYLRGRSGKSARIAERARTFEAAAPAAADAVIPAAAAPEPAADGAPETASE